MSFVEFLQFNFISHCCTTDAPLTQFCVLENRVWSLTLNTKWKLGCLGTRKYGIIVHKPGILVPPIYLSLIKLTLHYSGYFQYSFYLLSHQLYMYICYYLYCIYVLYICIFSVQQSFIMCFYISMACIVEGSKKNFLPPRLVFDRFLNKP